MDGDRALLHRNGSSRPNEERSTCFQGSKHSRTTVQSLSAVTVVLVRKSFPNLLQHSYTVIVDEDLTSASSPRQQKMLSVLRKTDGLCMTRIVTESIMNQGGPKKKKAMDERVLSFLPSDKSSDIQLSRPFLAFCRDSRQNPRSSSTGQQRLSMRWSFLTLYIPDIILCTSVGACKRRTQVASLGSSHQARGTSRSVCRKYIESRCQ